MAQRVDRELDVNPAFYKNQNYFRHDQMFSYWAQIDAVRNQEPANVLEIGLGNGFVSTNLLWLGFDVKTLDVNPALDPDVVCSVTELNSQLKGQKFSMTLCCEVLEHLPLEEFERALWNIASVTQDLVYLTLPLYGRSYGISAHLKIPKAWRYIDWYVRLPVGRLPDMHWWEIGSSKASGRKRIMDSVRKYFDVVVARRVFGNPYHYAFLCRPCQKCK